MSYDTNTLQITTDASGDLREANARMVDDAVIVSYDSQRDIAVMNLYSGLLQVVSFQDVLSSTKGKGRAVVSSTRPQSSGVASFSVR